MPRNYETDETLIQLAASNNCFVPVRHISEQTNYIEYALSRFQITSFRCLAPEADSHRTLCFPWDEVINTDESLWVTSICKLTIRAYKTDVQCLLVFPLMNSIYRHRFTLNTLPVIDEIILIGLVSQCHGHSKLCYKTIKLYLAGLR